MTTVAERLEAVRSRITEAALEAQRDPSEIRLLAVSKRHSSTAIREAYEAGQRDFGENYVQELEQKRHQLSDLPGLHWHMIGHVQRNKAKDLVGIASRVSSVDSQRLADELARRHRGALDESGQTRGPLPVLIEVNLAGESSKTGVAPSAALDLARHVISLKELRLDGLMAIPPRSAGQTQSRSHFDQAAALLRQLRETLGAPLPELSLGMSDDLEQAIAAGSTEVRIGTAVFGPRPQPT